MELNESFTNLMNDEPPGYRPPSFAADLRAAGDLYSTAQVDLLLDAKTNDVDFQAAVAAINAELATKAPINSPVFTGSPQAPTPATPSNDAQIATTAFVQAKINSIYTASDVLAKLLTVDGIGSGLDAERLGGILYSDYALLASPAFTGTPTVPTPSTADISLKIANTQLVSDKITLAFAVNFTPSEILTKLKTVDGTGSGLDTDFFRGLAPSAFATPGDLTAYAPLASPALTGTPTAPTPSAATNNTQIATTAFVQASYAKIASPAFTGTPTAPTATAGTNTTQIATTAFVQAATTALLGSSNTWTANNSFTGGINFGSGVAASATDLTRHINLHSGSYGFSVTTGGHLNYNTGGDHVWYVSGVEVARLGPAGAFTLAAPLAVSQGGTGQTTITGIRTALGLAPIATSGSAADITAGTLADARLPTTMTGKTFSTAVTFGDGDLTDGETILTINTERPWVFRQRGDAGTTNLSIENITQKQIGFSSDATYAGAVILLNPVTADPYITIAGNRVWHAGNDGPGSGLDADLLDGYHASDLFRDNADFTSTGNMTLSNTSPYIRLQDTTASAYDGRLRLDANNIYIDGSSDGVTYAEVLRFELDTKIGYMSQLFLTTSGEAIRLAAPSAGNDPYISFYQGATRTAYIQYQDGAGTGAGLRLQNDFATGDSIIFLTNDGGVSGFRYFNNGNNYEVYHTGNLTLTDLSGVPTSRTVTAGNGLTGGGALSANIALTMGTPSNITNSTTNSVTSTSHTHALGFTAAEVYTGSNQDELNFPLGHIILCTGGTTNRNQTATPYNRAAANQYTTSVVGSALAGTWRARGQDSDTWMILQRTA